jgi:hypothetical protein
MIAGSMSEIVWYNRCCSQERFWMTPSSEVTKQMKDVWKQLSTVDFIS